VGVIMWNFRNEFDEVELSLLFVLPWIPSSYLTIPQKKYNNTVLKMTVGSLLVCVFILPFWSTRVYVQIQR